ncbi:ABC transporter permease [Variovorax terrae]|uniref:ABC transporter permease subunit n=1 Tax=Variovorax terrae TaxID=2923278 RepID=A0A9X2AKW7_9BURK|nr:ABC transporter permease subunit [Variovorax terrae]MCJ0761599.1 ABC transporter permease subunit [Variovorax terrae]
MKPDARGLIVPLSLLALAEAGMRLSDVQSDALARPTQVAAALWQALVDGSIWLGSCQTLWAALSGLILGGGLGLLTGVWLGLSRPAAQASALSVELLRPVPSVALIPVSLLMFGFGSAMEIAVVAFTCFWPMLILTQAAIRQVDPRLLEVARVLGFSPLARVGKIVLPAALPRIFVAFRLSVGIALVVGVTVEIAANPQGLGYALMSAQQSLRPDLMFALVVWIGLLGWGVSAGLLGLQRRWFRHSLSGAPGDQP